MTSTSQSQTYEIANMIVEQLHDTIGHQAIIIAMSGPLGAGKTQLTKGLAAALGITDNVVSPTFVLETEYHIPKTELKFVHLDAYRLAQVEELNRLGLENRVKAKSVIALEWADKFDGFLNQFAGEAKIVTVKIALGKTESERVIDWTIA